MKEPRVEKLVEELKFTVDKLNRITAILAKTGTVFYLGRATKDGEFTLTDIEQKVEY